MRKIINYFAYFLLFTMPVGWLIIYMSYSTWKAYRLENYNVPKNFFKYLYQHNFLPYVSYRKNDLNKYHMGIDPYESGNFKYDENGNIVWEKDENGRWRMLK